MTPRHLYETAVPSLNVAGGLHAAIGDAPGPAAVVEPAVADRLSLYGACAAAVLKKRFLSSLGPVSAVLNEVPRVVWIAPQQQLALREIGPRLSRFGVEQLLSLKEHGGPVGEGICNAMLDAGVTAENLAAPMIPSVGAVLLVTAVSSLTTSGVGAFYPRLWVPKKLSDYDERGQASWSTAKRLSDTAWRGGAVAFSIVSVNSFVTDYPRLKALKMRAVARGGAAEFFGSLIPETNGRLYAWIAESLNTISFAPLVGLAKGKASFSDYRDLTAVATAQSVMGGKIASNMNHAFADYPGLLMPFRQFAINLPLNSLMALVGAGQFNSLVSLGLHISAQIAAYELSRRIPPLPAVFAPEPKKERE